MQEKSHYNFFTRFKYFLLKGCKVLKLWGDIYPAKRFKRNILRDLSLPKKEIQRMVVGPCCYSFIIGDFFLKSSSRKKLIKHEYITYKYLSHNYPRLSFALPSAEYFESKSFDYIKLPKLFKVSKAPIFSMLKIVLTAKSGWEYTSYSITENSFIDIGFNALLSVASNDEADIVHEIGKRSIKHT